MFLLMAIKIEETHLPVTLILYFVTITVSSQVKKLQVYVNITYLSTLIYMHLH